MALMKASMPFVKVTFIIFAAVLTSFDLTDAVPPKPENISCVLYAKRILTCNYDLPDDAERNLTTCTTCSQSTKEQTLNDTCPDVISGLACNTSAGKCVYNCDSLTFCDDYHMINITLTGSDAAEVVSMCRQIRTKEYIQPGPVRDLRVTAINSTALQVAWKKPYDGYRFYDKYAYTVRYMDTVKHIKKLRTKEEDIEIVLSDLLPWRNYNVTVRARPRNKGFRSLPQTVSTLDDTVPPKPENISCVLYAKRVLTCNYDLPDDAERNLTTCTICSQSIEEQTLNGTCPDVISGLACSTSAGKCVYNCDSLTFCDDYHMINITLTGSDATEVVSMCRQIRTKEYIQPGPVRDLRVTAINSTALQVAWKKPYDRYRYYDKYAYTVRYMDTVKHIKKLRTKEEDIEIVLSDLLPWRNYNVTVRARPRKKGFRSLPQTVSTLDDKNQTSSPDAQREPEKSVVATVVFTVVFSAMSAVLIAGVAVLIKERVRCDRITIILPKMMPLSVSGGNDRSFLQQESRRRRNEAELSELKDGVNGICEEDPICGRCPDTNAALEGEMQPRDCAENSMEKNVKSAPCLQENEVETSQEKPEENEHVETWSCSTYTGMSAYSYKQVTLSNGCPWTVDKS